jgi:DNA polymerase (family X)
MPATLLSKTDTRPNNTLLAEIFHRMGACYRYLGKDHRFRAGAYEKVSRLLHNMKEDITVYKDDTAALDALSGIGESIALKIQEYLQTGTIKTFEKLKKKVPYELLGLMEITGIGPATIKRLHDDLHIRNMDGLYTALEKGALNEADLRGRQSMSYLKRTLKLQKESNRTPLKEALLKANELLGQIEKIPGVAKAVLAGSLRRQKETIGDIDIVVIAAPKKRKKISETITAFAQVDTVLARGLTKISVLLKTAPLQLDIRIIKGDEYGAALLYFTGPKEHTVQLRIRARNKGYKLNEYGLFEAETGKKLAGATETGIYHLLDLEYIPPEQRRGNGYL